MAEPNISCLEQLISRVRFFTTAFTQVRVPRCFPVAAQQFLQIPSNSLQKRDRSVLQPRQGRPRTTLDQWFVVVSIFEVVMPRNRATLAFRYAQVNFPTATGPVFQASSFSNCSLQPVFRRSWYAGKSAPVCVRGGPPGPGCRPICKP